MPKLRPLLAIVAVAALVDLAPLAAQDAPPHGTEFWLAFMERFVSPDDPGNALVQLRLEIVAGDRAADVRVEAPAGGWSASVSLAAGAAGAVILPAPFVVSDGSEVVDRRSVHVTASAPIVVNAISHEQGSADATTVLPIDALGRDYLVATYDPLIVSQTLRGYAELVVVAVDDGTTVEITPAAATLSGRPAGVPFTVSLERGERYQLQSTGNLTGTRVRTVDGTPCDRIALFAGNVMAEVECPSVDHLYEQMLPIAALGREYLYVPSGGRRGGDVVEIIATEDSTLLTDWTGAPSPRLDAGARLRVRIDTAARIQATRPVIVMQYARGRLCDDAEAGDPFALQLRPIDVDDVVDFVAPGTLTFTRHFLAVTVREADAASLAIDGVPFTATRSFADAPGYRWVQLQVGPGRHRVTGAGIAGAVLTGIGQSISYGVDLSGSVRPGPSPADVPITRSCTCEGVVLEAPEGFASYRWSSGETTRRIVARASGDYTVTVGTRACVITSDTARITVRDDVRLTRLEPRAATVSPGDVIPYTLIVADRTGTTTCGSGVELVALRFRASMLAPGGIAGARAVGDSLDGADRIVTLRLTRDTVIFDMIAAFGDTVAAALVLDAVGVDSCLRPVGDTLSRLAFTDCDVGGRRLFLDREAAAIKPVRPEPIRGEGVVEFRTQEEGATRLELVDLRGLIVATLLDDVLAPGDHAARLEATALPAGVYLLVLRTPSKEAARRIVVAE